MNWSIEDIPDQTGKIALITGANSGIGFEAAKALASKGAKVILACRNQQKAQTAMDSILKEQPSAQLEFLQLDLADQTNIKTAVKRFLESHSQLDLLINNAGVMWLPRTETVDGFEMQFGTNHLGHFTLTGLLLDTLLGTSNARVVTVSSLAHRSGRIYFDDLMLQTDYKKHKSYAQSKLANLMFSNELQRRINQSGKSLLSVAVHPGGSSTNLAVPGFEMQDSTVQAKIAKWITPLVTQSAANGSLPTLYGATSNNIKGGEYIGPKHFFEVMGPPVNAYATRYSRNVEHCKKLWEASVALTDVAYSALS